MDEYITRNNAISVACFGCNLQFSNKPCEPSECTIRQSIMALPTADVVSKSEVEELKADLEVWKQNRFNIFQMLELYKMTRQEIAREIFEEIANMMVLQHGFNERHIVAHIDFELLKELRKKYTEGETDEKQQTCQG